MTAAPETLRHPRTARWRAAAVAACAVVFFVAVNIWAEISLSNQRFDATHDSLFTLSDNTRAVLRDLDEPVTLRLLRSPDLEGLGGRHVSHARRVGEMLKVYARVAGDKLRLSTVSVAPFSAAEELAVGAGIEGIANTAGTRLYLGLIATNSTDGREVIGHLSPERARFLEYDLTRLIHDLATPKKPVVALLGDLPLFGDRTQNLPPATVIDSVRGFFELRAVMGKVARFDDDVDVVMIAQAARIDIGTLYALDQFVMRGGRLAIFADPLAEAMPGDPNAGPINRDGVSALLPLLWHYGAAVAVDRVAVDRRAATKVNMTRGGRTVVTEYLPWGEFDSESLAADEAITGNLRRLNLRSAGIVSLMPNSRLTLTPLVRTSPDSATVPVAALDPAPDPFRLLAEFKAGGQALTLAARLGGPVTSAFPKGPPAEVTDPVVRAGHRATATAPLAMVLVADSDLLTDRTWLAPAGGAPGGAPMPFANNGDFVVNTLDQLSGGAALMALRGRGVGSRRLTVLDDMKRAADSAYRQREASLETAIDDLKRQINDLAGGRDGAALTLEDTIEIEAARRDILALGEELRTIQFDLREDLRALTMRVRTVNLLAVPAVLALGLLVVAGGRWLRRRRACGIAV